MWRQSGDHPLQQSWPRLQKAASLYLPGWQWHCVCKVTHMQTHTYKRTEHSFNQSGYTHHIVHQNSPCCSLCISIMTLQLMHLGLFGDFSSEGEATLFSICHIQKHTKAQPSISSVCEWVIKCKELWIIAVLEFILFIYYYCCWAYIKKLVFSLHKIWEGKSLFK